MGNRLALKAVAALYILFQIIGCKSNGTGMNSNNSIEDNMVIPRIADAAPSRLSESYSSS